MALDTPGVMPAVYPHPRLGLGLADGGRAQDDAVHQPEVEFLILGVLQHRTWAHYVHVTITTPTDPGGSQMCEAVR